MGLLLSLLKGGAGDDIVVDFENARPTEHEREIFDTAHQVLHRSNDILEALRNYQPATEFVQKALGQSNDEAVLRTSYEEIIKRVVIVNSFYEYSQELADLLPKLLAKLSQWSSADSASDAAATLSNQQAIAKQMADLLNFLICFDEMKMRQPALQNDFAFYKRNFARISRMFDVTVSEQNTNAASLWLAEASPMMSTMAQPTARLFRDNRDVLTTLGAMSNICGSMVRKKRFESVETNLFCLRAMVGAIILYDHVHPIGAFHRRSEIKMSKNIDLLLSFTAASTENLLNVLRYSSKHLNDDSTPASIQDKLSESR
eukprot:GILJ01000753.1.p1 GENE.GILJ01000753.1~~GILJ01000753.1.p1  ORF type:complete len:316 (+),score=47.54 GILJ01000753.1:39-986(+)